MAHSLSKTQVNVKQLYSVVAHLSCLKRGAHPLRLWSHHLGHRQLIGFRQAIAESEDRWEVFLEDLYQPALRGKRLHLVVTDGAVATTR